jgi:E3 ubiquitin-protein ligase CCNP1IP1
MSRADMLVDKDNLQRKNEELAQAFRDKSRKHSQTQELYDKLKRRFMLGQVQNAASDAVDHTIHSSAVSNCFVDPTTGFDQCPRQLPLFAESQETRMPQSGFSTEGGNLPSMPPPVARPGMNGGWSGSDSQENNQR